MTSMSVVTSINKEVSGEEYPQENEQTPFYNSKPNRTHYSYKNMFNILLLFV